jgi:CheY-like chemotaxis protein
MTREWKILLAEDSADDRLLIARALKVLKTVTLIHTLEDGQEVIEYLAGQSPYGDREKFPVPDLILLDLKMPRASGFEVLEWIRNFNGVKPLVVVLSSSEVPDEEKRALALGANLYLVKSYNMVETLRPLVPFLAKASEETP